MLRTLRTGLAVGSVALATALSAAAAGAAPVTAAAPAIRAAGASCIVTGYTLHAEEEMAKDSIGSDYVETVVHNTCHQAKKQSNGRYRYTDGRIVVIAEPTGYVVTVYRL